jgi:hypothetical protein
MHWDENHTESTLKTFACEVLSAVGEIYYNIKSFWEDSDVHDEDGLYDSSSGLCAGSSTDDMLMRLSIERYREAAHRNQASDGDINGDRKNQQTNRECN